MAPNKYIVRHGQWSQGPGSGFRHEERRVWAFSAADAKFQVETYFQDNRDFGGVIYVGPVNESCQCLNECFCGISVRG